MSGARPVTVAGRLLLGREFVEGTLTIERGRIVRIHRGVASEEADVGAEIVAPGYIDLQVNGGYGVEATDGPAALRTLATRLPATGVTTFLPTVVSSPDECYRNLASMIGTMGDVPGARPLGFHLEGPLISEQRKGAHEREVIANPAGPAFRQLLSSGTVRLVTLAPERADALELIPRLRASGIAVSLGHSDATYEQFVAGVDAGATMATHVFNAMSPFEHRDPGAIGATLADSRLTAGLIPDGIHSHPASVRLAVAAKGVDRIALVTDMMSAAGMPPGEYVLAGRRVRSDGVSARLSDGTLAGAILTMDAAVRNMVRWGGVSLPDAIRMASEVPARVLGLADAGSIVEGSAADLVLLDRSANVQLTLVGGEVRYTRGRADGVNGTTRDHSWHIDMEYV